MSRGVQSSSCLGTYFATLILIQALLVGRASAADSRSVIVAIDQETYQARDRQTRIDLLKTQVSAALSEPRSIQVVTNDREVTVTVSDLAHNAGFIDAARKRFSGRSQFTVSVRPAETFQVAYSPAAMKAFGKKGFDRDIGALEGVVRGLRPPLPNIQIEGDPDGAIIRTASPAAVIAVTEAIRERLHGMYALTPRTDASWRVALDPATSQWVGPAQRLLMAAEAEYPLRAELRDPVDLETEMTAKGVKGTIVDPDHHEAFAAALQTTFADNADFILTRSPAQVLRIARPEGSAPVPSNAQWPDAMFGVANELEELATPPAITVELPDGLAVRAKNPAQNADRAARVRQAVASRNDLTVKTQPDLSLVIRFADALPSAPPPEEGRLARVIQARLRGMKLQASSVSAIDAGHVEVQFATIADADNFRGGLSDQYGFSFRLVDEDAMARDAPQTSPSPGDERVPQAEGGFLWLKPGAIISGDMIADAKVGIDAMTETPDVNFWFTGEGQTRFAAATEENIGRRFAIVLDGVVVSAPTIQSAITGGSGQVTGDFTAEAAMSAARSMMAYRDDLPLKVVPDLPTR